MTYRETRKAAKIHSERQVAAKARQRMDRGPREPYIELDHYMKITVERKATGEVAVFECFEGDRIDNYSVYCNDRPLGIQSVTTLMANISKALPRFRRMES